jgi:predicted NAD/FAD-binding protein
MDKDKYQTVTDGLYILQGSLNRIANALEEVLRLVKADQEKVDKYRKENNEQ